MKKTFINAEKFIYLNARPLDFALWRYHFESGSAQDVYDILEKYQNPDGGFGHDIEPDNWNINSNPIAVWQATCILEEVGVPQSSAIVSGILKYLDECEDYTQGKWCNPVKSTNDYPHAVWWECRGEKSTPDDNPSVSLAGFVLKYGKKNSRLYQKAQNIARNAAKNFIENPIEEFHILRCYLDLAEYLENNENFDLFDLDEFRNAVFAAVNKAVCKQPEKWFTEYVAKPSTFFDKSSVIFDIVGKNLCEIEGKLIIENQQDDGAFPVTWLWYNDYTEYYIAANRWKSSIVRKNILFLKALGMI